MLELKVLDREFYNEKENLFFVVKGGTLVLEHSLVSISKWEAKWKKPFLTKETKTVAETLDYIRFMTINQHVPDSLYTILTAENVGIIAKYIDDPMTATTFRETTSGNREIVTSELIYYWMVAYNIPFECQKWHLNRLLTLVRVCNAKNKSEKMTRKQILSNNAALNRERRAKMGSKG